MKGKIYFPEHIVTLGREEDPGDWLSREPKEENTQRHHHRNTGTAENFWVLALPPMIEFLG
jgi:hypothetical protein